MRQPFPTSFRRARPFFLPLVLALAFAAGSTLLACHGDGPTGPHPMGRLQIRLTDAPTAEADAVNVFVSGLTIKRVGEPAELHLANELGLFDLLTLQGTTQELVDFGVAAGDYEFVQIELDPARSNIVETSTGEEKPVQIPSREIKVLGGFTVPEGGDTTVTLDFDAAASLRHLGNGDWLLTPVISQSVGTVP